MKLQAGPENRGQRLDHFLASRLADVTRSQIQILNRSGRVHIEGRQEKAGYRLRGTETVEVDLDSLTSSPLQAEHIPLQIYYEDADMAVIEKTAGLVVHPGSGARTGTVVQGLMHHFAQLSTLGGEGRPGIVHRLDKKTSGLLVVAKNNTAHAALGKQFHDRRVEKTYIALVHGKVTRPTGEIELAIGRDPIVRTRMTARPQRGRSAHSEYSLKEVVREFSLLDVKITTGRTHQIRVHLSAIGHPVVGDDVYGERRHREFVKAYGDPGRYFLHAAELRLRHPAHPEVMEFHSPLPAELQNLLTRIRLGKVIL